MLILSNFREINLIYESTDFISVSGKDTVNRFCNFDNGFPVDEPPGEAQKTRKIAQNFKYRSGTLDFFSILRDQVYRLNQVVSLQS